MNKLSLNGESELYYNQHVNVIKKDDILDINYLNNHGRVYVIGGKISNYKLLLIQIILLIKIKSLMSQIFY